MWAEMISESSRPHSWQSEQRPGCLYITSRSLDTGPSSFAPRGLRLEGRLRPKERGQLLHRAMLQLTATGWLERESQSQLQILIASVWRFKCSRKVYIMWNHHGWWKALQPSAENPCKWPKNKAINHASNCNWNTSSFSDTELSNVSQIRPKKVTQWAGVKSYFSTDQQPDSCAWCKCFRFFHLYFPSLIIQPYTPSYGVSECVKHGVICTTVTLKFKLSLLMLSTMYTYYVHIRSCYNKVSLDYHDLIQWSQTSITHIWHQGRSAYPRSFLAAIH